MSKRYLGGVITANSVTPTDSFQDSAAPGMWTSAQQMQLKAAGLWPLFGNANPSQFIENLFSTYLYTGTNAAQTITNGIDLAGKGGLVWCKERNAGQHSVWDTSRGVKNLLITTQTAANLNIPVTYPAYPNYGLQSFNSNGFALGKNWEGENADGSKLVSWTFREQPKFFDIVTYTGTGVARTVAHNLGSVPGTIIVKSTTSASNWYVYHRSLATNQALKLNSNAATETFSGFWNNTAPTSTEFTVGTAGDTNGSGNTFVAYIFAHDAGGFGLSGTENVISCGSYVGNSSIPAPVVTLGWEPQYVLIKAANASDPYYGDWFVFDTARGIFTSGTSDPRNNVIPDPSLKPNSSAAEGTTRQVLKSIGTGFQIESDSATDLNQNGTTYIYIAIRRGPMAVPTLGTTVYNAITRTGTGTAATITGVGFPPDLAIIKARSIGDGYFFGAMVADKLRGPPRYLVSSAWPAENAGGTGDVTAFNMNGISVGGSTQINYGNAGSYVNWFFLRAPSVFDAGCYTGEGSPRTVAHNLTVAPELIIIKRRDTGADWFVYHAAMGNTKYLNLNNSNSATIGAAWDYTSPTASVFSLGSNGNVNASAGTFVAYLFATCAGVSKVGSYIGTGTTQAINCGFTAGARFVMIKRTDDSSDWYVWDSARGIVSGNDPYLSLNSDAAEVTNTDYIDTSAAGFEISSTAPAEINASGGSYIFLAIS